MSEANKKHDLSTLKQMRLLLDLVSMNCCDSGGVLDEINEVIDMIKEWIKELEDDS
tara:strand:+ start:213 stop:380 length:168 start_codon:yes stop_codon:yes gene_type:complete